MKKLDDSQGASGRKQDRSYLDESPLFIHPDNNLQSICGNLGIKYYGNQREAWEELCEKIKEGLKKK